MNNPTLSEEPIKKIYWHIGEIAEMFHVAQSAVRFWEKEFCLHFHRKHGKRIFTQEDIEKIREIDFLLNVEGMKIWGAKRKLESHE